MIGTLTGEDEDGNPKTITWAKLVTMTEKAIDDDFHAIFARLCRASSGDVETESDRLIRGIDNDQVTTAASSTDALNTATLNVSARANRRPLDEPVPLDELDEAESSAESSESEQEEPTPPPESKPLTKKATSIQPGPSTSSSKAPTAKERNSRVSKLLSKCRANGKLTTEPRTKKLKK